MRCLLASCCCDWLTLSAQKSIRLLTKSGRHFGQTLWLKHFDGHFWLTFYPAMVLLCTETCDPCRDNSFTTDLTIIFCWLATDDSDPVDPPPVVVSTRFREVGQRRFAAGQCLSITSPGWSSVDERIDVTLWSLHRRPSSSTTAAPLATSIPAAAISFPLPFRFVGLC